MWSCLIVNWNSPMISDHIWSFFSYHYHSCVGVSTHYFRHHWCIHNLWNHTWRNSIKTHKKIRGLQFLDMLNLFERTLHFYRPIIIAQMSLGEIWDQNFLLWWHSIYLGISWWFYCKWRQRAKWLRVNSRLSWALLPAD